MLISSLLFTGAAGTVLTAHAFEILGGYLPCHLCLIERYAYYFAILASIAAFFAARAEKDDVARIIFLLVALAFLGNAALGFYHSGVEWKWWPGPTECSGGSTIQWGEGGLAGSLATINGWVSSKTNGKIPTILDTPTIPVDVLELADDHAPYGLRGVGEAPTLSSTPAVLAAIRSATGLELNRTPVRPEHLTGTA